MHVTPRAGRWPLFVMLSVAVAGLMLATAPRAVAEAASVPLIDAVKAADVEAVRRLLQQEAVDVNVSEADGTTALHWAAHQGDLESLQLLLASGAEPDRPNRYGRHTARAGVCAGERAHCRGASRRRRRSEHESA